MSFDLFAMQQLILTRLAPVAGGIPLVDSFVKVDLSDNGAETTTGQVFFLEFSPEEQVGVAFRQSARWSFDLYIDTERAGTQQKEAAMALFSAAMAALIGWKFAPGREVQSSPGQESGWDGRVLHISFGFTLPVYMTGN
jgi:hypothetical protein